MPSDLFNSIFIQFYLINFWFLFEIMWKIFIKKNIIEIHKI